MRVTGVHQYLGWIGDNRTFKLVGLAVVVGVAGGLAAVALRLLLPLFHRLFFVYFAQFLYPLSPNFVVLLPALGGLLVGLMVVFLAREARGAGVADVVLAVRYRGGRMRPRVAAVKVVATSLAIGSGGSAGIEGPIIQIGSALGSAIGQWMRLSEEDLRVLLAAGAAAGIAATFNTPLAGVFFAMEVILAELSSRSFGLVVISAVVASMVARLTVGDALVIAVPVYVLVNPGELLLYLLLGVLAAILGVAFIYALDGVEATFARWRIPRYLKPAVGGLAVGLIGLLFPQVFGLGYGTVEAAITDRLPLPLMASLVVAKLLSTSVTVGSGSSGGVIGPSLYLGAVLGGSVGTVFHALLPQVAASPGAYALVGMAAVFAATARAPITAIFTLFELSSNYYIILPLMVACVASAYLAGRLCPHTIYSKGLGRRGIDVRVESAGPTPVPGMKYLDLSVVPGSQAAGKRVKELALPTECVLISVRRGNQVMIARGDTLLDAGDEVIVACTPPCEGAVRELMGV